jgi:hypothetical protein
MSMLYWPAGGNQMLHVMDWDLLWYWNDWRLVIKRVDALMLIHVGPMVIQIWVQS